MKKEYRPLEIIESPVLQKFLVGQEIERYHTEIDVNDPLYNAYLRQQEKCLKEKNLDVETESYCGCELCKKLAFEYFTKGNSIVNSEYNETSFTKVKEIKQDKNVCLYHNADCIHIIGDPHDLSLSFYNTHQGMPDSYYAMDRIRAEKIYRAACCLVIDPETNLVLAVSRKNNHDMFGFPGGSVEDNETFLEGALRELQEETGYVLNDTNYVPAQIHEHLVKDRHVKLFSVPFNELTDTEQRLKGEGVLKFVSWNKLLNGPFGDTIIDVYNDIYHFNK